MTTNQSDLRAALEQLVKALNDYDPKFDDFPDDSLAAARAALAAEPVGEPLTDSFVQRVPDHCDRITWRNSYYSLSALSKAPLAPVVGEGATNWPAYFLRVTDKQAREIEGILRQPPPGMVEALPASPPALAVGENADRSHISDGYHTFAELYDHRHSLMLALMRAIPQLCWFSQRHADGELPFGTAEWFIAGAALPAGAITYHLPSELLSLARQTGAVELSVGRPWDGHTPNDVIKRLRGWAGSPQPAPAEGEVE